MSCGSKKRVALATSIELQSMADGSPRVWWGPVVPFSASAILLRLMILYTRGGSVRFRGRYSIDGTTWLPANSSDVAAMVGYLDRGAAITSTNGLWTHQYLGIASEHAELFQIGIEIDSTGTQEASVTLSAEAEFGGVLAVTTADIATSGVPMAPAGNPPVPVPGAMAIKTAGARAVRIQARFAAVVGASAPALFLATGTSSTPANMICDSAATGRYIAAVESDASFVVEGPSDWACVYYQAGTATPSLSSLTMTILP